MFTGLVEEMGTLRRRAAGAAAGSVRLTFDARQVTTGVAVGDSLSVNGCCLTVVEIGPEWWSADAVEETLSRTNLGQLAVGDRVNFERPLKLGDSLGGHLVQGHVDGVGRVTRPAPDLLVEAPTPLLKYLAEKGSIAVDGVSLTVVEITEGGFRVAVIPHTVSVTTLGTRAVGDEVNLEVDVIAKYAERLLGAGVESPYRHLVGVSKPPAEGG